MAGEDMQIRFSFRSLDAAGTVAVLEAMLEGLTQHNEIWFAQNRDTPCCLLHAGVRYVDPMLCDRRGFCQVILAADKMLEEKVGTCADMSAYVAAWIRSNLGVGAWVKLEEQSDHYGRPIPHAYHACVVTANGERYDPSEEVKAGICRCPGGAQ